MNTAFARFPMPKGTKTTTTVLSARVKSSLADRFGALIAAQGYNNPSDAIRDLVRQFVARHPETAGRKAA